MIHHSPTFTEEYLALAQNSWLFQNVLPETVCRLCWEKGQILAFAKGEVIYSPTHFQRSIGLFLSGSAQVEKGGGTVILNTLRPGDWFGVAALFSQSCRYVATVRAASSCRVAFFTYEGLTAMLAAEPVIGLNYISFLSSRIHFLNRKIDQFTAVSAEEKVALYLLEQTGNGSSFSLPMSYAKLADSLDLSRSSLYRAMDALENAGVLKKEGRRLTVLDPEGLEQWTQPDN